MLIAGIVYTGFMTQIPNYQKLLLPVLVRYADQGEYQLRDVAKVVADELGLTDEERAIRTSSGTPVINNRVSWAHTYLRRAGLIESVRKGVSRITDRGLAVLATNPTEITNKDLEVYPEFVDFKKGDTSKRSDGVAEEADKEPATDLTPEERIDDAMRLHNRALEEELLEILRGLDPVYFEQVVVDLLEKMGYGTGKTTKITGDGGIDGIINEDALGLSQIYMQAKRYGEGNVVNGKEVRDFYGALALNQVSKGVFITTSRFNTTAIQATPPHMKVVFVDGKQLAQLLVRYEVGVTPIRHFATKAVDSDYYQQTT